MSDSSGIEPVAPDEQPTPVLPPVPEGTPKDRSIPTPPPPAAPQSNLAFPVASSPRVATDQQQISGGVLAVAWIVAVLTVGYMLPWAIAASRGKANHGAIALINVLTGWTVVGWVVALVMACQAHQVVASGMQATVVVADNPGSQSWQQRSTPAGWYPSPSGQGQRYWDGSAWTDHYAPSASGTGQHPAPRPNTSRPSSAPRQR